MNETTNCLDTNLFDTMLQFHFKIYIIRKDPFTIYKRPAMWLCVFSFGESHILKPTRGFRDNKVRVINRGELQTRPRQFQQPHHAITLLLAVVVCCYGIPSPHP